MAIENFNLLETIKPLLDWTGAVLSVPLYWVYNKMNKLEGEIDQNREEIKTHDLYSARNYVNQEQLDRSLRRLQDKMSDLSV
jgi:hypothetical protein